MDRKNEITRSPCAFLHEEAATATFVQKNFCFFARNVSMKPELSGDVFVVERVFEMDHLAVLLLQLPLPLGVVLHQPYQSIKPFASVKVVKLTLALYLYVKHFVFASDREREFSRVAVTGSGEVAAIKASLHQQLLRFQPVKLWMKKT